jgi:type II secretory pathway pseudopilin PulG
VRRLSILDSARRMARVSARRGVLLLEVVVSVAVFVMASLAIVSLVGGSVDSLGASRDAVRAMDLARSAMARLEAGLDTPQSLPGPVPLWADDHEAVEADEVLGKAGGMGGGFADSPPRPSLWEIEVETEGSEFRGLTRVTVRAIKRASPGSDRVAASYALHQLVRLSGKGEDRAGSFERVVEPPSGGRTGRPAGRGP